MFKKKDSKPVRDLYFFLYWAVSLRFFLFNKKYIIYYMMVLYIIQILEKNIKRK